MAKTDKKPKAAPAKTAPAKAAPAKKAAAGEAKKSLTKTQIFQALAEETKLTKKQISEVFEALTSLIRKQVSKKGPGQVILPTGLIKIKRATKPATKQREGRNPLTGETIIIAAKKERDVIKAQALKTLKEMVNA